MGWHTSAKEEGFTSNTRDIRCGVGTGAFLKRGGEKFDLVKREDVS